MDKQKEYIERLSAHMFEWDSQIDLLGDISENISPETDREYSNKIAELQHKRDEVSVKLHGLAFARDDDWEELKTGMADALGEIRALFNGAVTMFR